jgi:hypothetical protein
MVYFWTELLVYFSVEISTTYYEFPLLPQGGVACDSMTGWLKLAGLLSLFRVLLLSRRRNVRLRFPVPGLRTTFWNSSFLRQARASGTPPPDKWAGQVAQEEKWVRWQVPLNKNTANLLFEFNKILTTCCEFPLLPQGGVACDSMTGWLTGRYHRVSPYILGYSSCPGGEMCAMARSPEQKYC